MKQVLLVLCSVLMLSADSNLNSPEATNAKVKTVFIYNFTKYINWPSSYKSGDFVIGVLGSNAYLVKELNEMASKKKAGSQSFKIKSVSAVDKKSKYHVLFLSSSSSYSVEQVDAQLKGKSTLLVTEQPGLAKRGAAINFVFQNNRQKFELSKENIEKHDLKVSNNLVNIAINVD